MTAVYEILVRGDYNGKITGAHQILWETPKSVGAALPLDPATVGKLLGEAFPSLANDLAAAKARIAEQDAFERARTEELTAARARIAELEARSMSFGTAFPNNPIDIGVREPVAVTAYQVREALRFTPDPLGGGETLLDAVEAYVAAHAADHPTLKNAWDWIDPWERDSALVLGLGEAFGMTPENIDELFKLAATMKH